MRLSRSLIPTIKENPAEAQIVSHRLMLRAGLVRQVAAGSMPGCRRGGGCCKHIAQVVREEQDRVGRAGVVDADVAVGRFVA